MQLPITKTNYTEDELEGMAEAKASDGTRLFKDFYLIRLKKDGLGEYLHSVGYERQEGNQFVNTFGSTFDLEVLLKI